MSLRKRATNLLKGKVKNLVFVKRGERISNEHLEAELQKMEGVSPLHQSDSTVQQSAIGEKAPLQKGRQ